MSHKVGRDSVELWNLFGAMNIRARRSLALPREISSFSQCALKVASTLAMNRRICRQVLECGDGVREVTALVVAALKIAKRAAGTATPTQSGDSEDSVAAVQDARAPTRFALGSRTPCAVRRPWTTNEPQRAAGILPIEEAWLCRPVLHSRAPADGGRDVGSTLLRRRDFFAKVLCRELSVCLSLEDATRLEPRHRGRVRTTRQS
jgi:hypothetical protein